MNTKDDEKAAAVAAYNSVVASAKLDDIVLIFANFSIKPEYYDVTRSGEKSAKVKRQFDCEFSMLSYNADKMLLGGQFDWIVEAIHSRKKILQIRATYIVSYEKVPDVGEKHIEAFLRKVGRFATYPYFRSTVSQFSWESHADLPIMPVLT